MIKQSAFHPYPSEMLPTGFMYPEHYLKLAQSTHSIQYDEEYMFPWWFVDYGTEGAMLSYELRHSQIPNRNLIPFAQNGAWKAYFDGDSSVGNPKVIVIDLDNLPFHMVINHFDDWLLLAEQDYW